MNLKSLEGKRVRLIDVSGKTFEGIVGDYVYPEDNEPEGVASIILDISNDKVVEFLETEIHSIEVVG